MVNIFLKYKNNKKKINKNQWLFLAVLIVNLFFTFAEFSSNIYLYVFHKILFHNYIIASMTLMEKFAKREINVDNSCCCCCTFISSFNVYTFFKYLVI